jgi:hypothetical protein
MQQSLKHRRRVDFSKIAGVSFRCGGHVVHNPVHPSLQNLDSLPFPSWHLFKWKNTGRSWNSSTARLTSF